jgi:ABC-type amino acid transport substrate-binding protein
VGDTSGGTQLLLIYDFDAMHVNDIEWLPDASGFLFSMSYVNFEEFSDIFEYNFATQDITQLTPGLLVESGDGGAYGFSISPDGQQIAFERAVYPYDTPSSLWMMNRDGSDMHKFADDAGTSCLGSDPIAPGAHNYKPQPIQRHRRGLCVHPHGQWHRLCERLGRALE